MMNYGLTSMKPKVNYSEVLFQSKSNLTKVFPARSTWSPVFSENLDMSQPYHYNNSEQLILSSVQLLVDIDELSIKNLGILTAKMDQS